MGDWKGVRQHMLGKHPNMKIELYNLAADLGETKNLASTEVAKADELLRELDAWRKDVGAEMMKPNPDYDLTTPPAKKKKR